MRSSEHQHELLAIIQMNSISLFFWVPSLLQFMLPGKNIGDQDLLDAEIKRIEKEFLGTPAFF